MQPRVAEIVKGDTQGKHQNVVDLGRQGAKCRDNCGLIGFWFWSRGRNWDPRTLLLGATKEQMKLNGTVVFKTLDVRQGQRFPKDGKHTTDSTVAQFLP